MQGWSRRSVGDQVIAARILRDFITDTRMKGFGPTLMAEKLEQKEGIKLSKETIRRMMVEVEVWKPKTRKPVDPHLSRPRRKCRGELVQIDGSQHAWLEERGSKATLLVFVDDATSEILAAEFVPEECFFVNVTSENMACPKASIATSLASSATITEAILAMSQSLSSSVPWGYWVLI